jgi:hypothetical protein
MQYKKSHKLFQNKNEAKEAVLMFFTIPKSKVVELRETLLQGHHHPGTNQECIT